MKGKGKNEDKIFEDFYNDDRGDYIENAYKEYSVRINITGNYMICACGARADKGGRGSYICGKDYLEENTIINYRLGGRKAGGKGGKGCGSYWNRGNGFDGAGCAIISYSEKYLIVAGGGGGDSEDKKNKGGNYEENGEGRQGGTGATNQTGGEGGNKEAQDGIQYHGGNCSSSTDSGTYCGGGGGDGFYGGGAGGYGNEGNGYGGGGGGGSNYCKTNGECLYNEIGFNHREFSGIKIFKL